MVRKHPLLIVLAMSCLAGTVWSQAQVELKGTVKDGSGKGIEGAIVSITKNQMKATTSASGEFVIATPSGIVSSPFSDLNRVAFSINRQKVFFTMASETKDVALNIISANGQKVFELRFDNINRNISEIPQLKSGIYLIKLTAGTQQVVQKVITTGDQLIFSGVASSVNGGSSLGLRLASTANVDTIVATKSGYATKKVGIDAYVKSGIAITLDPDVTPGCKLPDLPASSALTTVNPKLPDPFTFYDGTKLTKKSQWECRRAEILAMASKYIYGPCPPKPDEVTGTVSGGTVNINCKVGTKTASFTATISGSGDAICLELSGGIFPSPHKKLTLGSGNASKIQTLYGVSGMIEDVANAWMIDRVIEVLELNPSSGHDPKKIMVSGCSGCGKGAFLAGVFSRIPLTVIVESGGGGAANLRQAEWFRHGDGKKIYDCLDGGAQKPPQSIDNLEDNGICGPWVSSVASWLRSSPAKVNNLPFDQHLLLACIAPRYLCHLTNQHGKGEWCHLGGTCEALSSWAAEPVFNALGVPDNMGFLMYTEGSAPQHCGNPSSATKLANEFFNRVFKGDANAKTDVMSMNASDLQQPQADWKAMWIDWDMETKLE
jgi:hypothetical protein